MTKEELGKKNQELKEQYAKECEDVCYVVTNYNKQLTKAKEIIDEFVFLLTHPRTTLDTKTVMQKAEQFLKETN